MSPSEMSEDSPVPADRLFALERAMEDSNIRGNATQQLLNNLLLKLGEASPLIDMQPPARRPDSRDPALASPIPTSLASSRRVAIKPSTPADFDGDRSKGKAFLTSCRTYIRLCPEAFDDETTKIVWAMSYMKEGRAGRWSACEFELEAASHPCRLRFLDWEDFEDEFRKDFTPLNEEAAAVNALETTSYFQGRRMVDDYLDQFRDLIHESGYSDPKTIVVKFRRGLDRRISTALASMSTGRPADTDPEAWYHLAVRMDQNRAADEAFHASLRGPPSIPMSTRPSQPPSQKLAPSAPLSCYAHTSPSPGRPVPMDIDAASKSTSISDTCRRCGDAGHWARNCPHRFDVRHMDADELQSAVEDKLAALDVAPPVAEQDFVSNSE